MATAQELRDQAAAFLQESFPLPAGVEDVVFSPFRREQVQEATELAREFGQTAERRGDENGVADVLASAREAVTQRLPSLVKYALLIFLTHHPIGARVGAPSLEERHPTAVESMIVTRADITREDPESLAFFREDVFANDHHAHWHMVYRSDWERQERQGEIFLYMHQQMLARYDAERLAVGRPEVAPLELADPSVIAEGYDPEMGESFGSRPDDTPLNGAGDLAARQDAFAAAVENRHFEGAYERREFADSFDPTGPQPVLNLLGATLEAEGAPLQFAGLNLHNDGHMVIAALGRGPQGNQLDGVMRDTSVAIRDPVFWRWHKLIDNAGAAWQETQPARDFSEPEDTGPQVTIRSDPAEGSLDLILCRAPDLPFDLADVAAGEAFGRETFGGEHWDERFSETQPGTGELQTQMTERTWSGSEITYLDLVDEFAYFVRVENPGDADLEVTARILIVPEQWSHDRRKWIEMDKFLQTVPPGRSVIYRPSSRSSVIRSPATRPPAPAPPSGDPEQQSYCGCGWPYNLLLPRGKEEGMAFRLLAMLTDAGWDKHDEEACGSMSYCGVRDGRYPDRRAMGYPFDRPFGDDGVVASLEMLENAATRRFSIRRVA